MKNIITISLIAVFVFSRCEKKDHSWNLPRTNVLDSVNKTNSINKNLPALTTSGIVSITQTSAQSGGNITNSGGAAIIASGICYSSSSNPTTSNSIVNSGVAIGSFTAYLTGLSADTKYYVRAFATNSFGTAYGNELSFTTSKSVPTYVAQVGLVGWWPFTGNANDLSVNGNHGTVFYATLTTDRNNQIASAYNFDCSNGWDKIYIPYNSNFNSPTITISAWFKSSTLFCNGDGHTIIKRFQYGYSNPNGEAWGLDVSTNSSISGFLKTQSPGGQGYLGSTGPGSISNQWVNVILSFDGTLLKQYINGQLYDTDSSSGFLLNTTGNSGISIGVSDQANGHWAPFDGKIDDIGIWNRALTELEITRLFKGQ